MKALEEDQSECVNCHLNGELNNGPWLEIHWSKGGGGGGGRGEGVGNQSASLFILCLEYLKCGSMAHLFPMRPGNKPCDSETSPRKYSFSLHKLIRVHQLKSPDSVLWVFPSVLGLSHYQSVLNIFRYLPNFSLYWWPTENVQLPGGGAITRYVCILWTTTKVGTITKPPVVQIAPGSGCISFMEIWNMQSVRLSHPQRVLGTLGKWCRGKPVEPQARGCEEQEASCSISSTFQRRELGSCDFQAAPLPKETPVGARLGSPASEV